MTYFDVTTQKITLERPFDWSDDVPNGDKVTYDVCYL